MATVKTETQTKAQPRIYGKIVLSLQNCILSELDEKPTPSEADGLDTETETDLRILGCELIQTAGILLRIPQVAMATGQVLFQRFFYSKSFVRHSMEAVAMSCVCLASKIEEAPRRVRDVINVFHHIKQVRAQKPLTPIILDQNYINLKNQVIKAERRVLKELGFCVHVKHPHKLVFMYLKFLDYEQNQQMMQMAWNFMNDSFRTDVFVRYQPEKIACACIYLTARKLGIALPNNPPWYGLFKTTEDEIVDICYRILALYKRSKPSIERLDAAVDKLKQEYQDMRKKEKGGNNTPPIATTVPDRNNGAHNAWGGFIARAEPLPLEKDPKEKDRSRSRDRDSRSKSNSKSSTPSRTPNEEKHRRKRSRTPLKKRKRNYSRSSSGSPHINRKYKKGSDKKYDRSPDRKDRYNSNGDRKRSDYDYDRYDDRDYEHSKSYKKDYKDRDYKDQRSDYKEKDYKEYKDYSRSKDKDRYYNGSGKDKYRSKHRERSRSPRDRRR